MEEFIKQSGKVLDIKNPISLFTGALSRVGTEAERNERWQTVNTLMAINNHRRIDHLESNLSAEQARVRFLEDYSNNLGGKVGKMEKSLEVVKSHLKSQKRTLQLILNLVKLVSDHSKSRSRSQMAVSFIRSAAQNAAIFGLVQVIMRMMWVDSIIDGLSGLLRLTRILSKKSMERSRIFIKFSVSIALFLLIRRKLMKLISKATKLLPFIL